MRPSSQASLRPHAPTSTHPPAHHTHARARRGGATTEWRTCLPNSQQNRWKWRRSFFIFLSLAISEATLGSGSAIQPAGMLLLPGSPPTSKSSDAAPTAVRTTCLEGAERHVEQRSAAPFWSCVREYELAGRDDWQSAQVCISSSPSPLFLRSMANRSSDCSVAATHTRHRRPVRFNSIRLEKKLWRLSPHEEQYDIFQACKETFALSLVTWLCAKNGVA